MKRIALIDGDELIYKIGFSSQHVHYEVYENEDSETWSARYPYKKQALAYINGQEGMVVNKVLEVEKPEVAVWNLKAAFSTIMSDTKAHDYRMFLTGDNNFRFDVATIQPYKNRDPSNKPVYYDMIKEILSEDYFAETIHGMEADDMLSICQYESFHRYGSWDKVDTIICTQDKDLNMVPGPRYSSRTRKLSNISVDEARRFFYCQLLSGDWEVDSIPGIYGIGMKTANRLLSRAKTEVDHYTIVLSEYTNALKSKKKGNLITDKSAEEVISEIGNLLWMKRHREDIWNTNVRFT